MVWGWVGPASAVAAVDEQCVHGTQDRPSGDLAATGASAAVDAPTSLAVVGETLVLLDPTRPSDWSRAL